MSTTPIILAKDSVFQSIQGEGSLCGVPSIFIRMAGCNLHCQWQCDNGDTSDCDTAYASYFLEKTIKSTVEETIEKVKQYSPLIRHIVITGGEPLLQTEALTQLTTQLHTLDYHITVETNGTIFNQQAYQNINLISLSPKLASSAPQNQYAEQHNKTRINISTLQQIAQFAKEQHKDLQVKFVLATNKDTDEILEITTACGINADQTWLMPACQDSETLNIKALWAINIATQHGWRYCDRLHLRLFGNKPGT